MKRVTYYFSIFTAVALAWVALYWCIEDGKHKEIVSLLPWYALILLGSYCLCKLGLDLVSFNDYPLEIQKLEKDVNEAKADLKKRGFKS
jgi:hypothetical protein